MKHIKLIGLGIFFILIINNANVYSQQSIQFTQYIFNSMSVNPAYTGYKEQWFAQIGLRSQWAGWEGAPRTGTISIDGVADPSARRHGVGMNVVMDQLGAQAATSIYANYALRLQLDYEDTQRLSLGIAGGVTQYSLDGNKLDPNDSPDPNLPTGKIANWKPDIRLGVYYYNPKWYLGVSVQDLFSGSNSGLDYQFDQNTTDNLYRSVSAYLISGALFELERGLQLRPSLLIKESFKGPTTIDLNAMFIFQDRFWIGAGYRSRAKIFKRTYEENSPDKLSNLNAVSGITQFYVSPRFRIGYSYDVMLNRLSGTQNGTHEVTLGFTFGQRTVARYVNPRYF